MATWADFYKKNSDKIEISGFPNGDLDKQRILLAMGIAYNGSQAFRKMVDNWVNKPIPPGASSSEPIIIKFKADTATGGIWTTSTGVPVGKGTGMVSLDIEYCKRVMYLSNTGEAIQHSLVSVLVHEMGHALAGRPDDGVGTAGHIHNGDPYDYKGKNVIETNKIFKELGLTEENSYLGQSNIGGGILTTGIQYTNGAEIDRSVVFSPNCTNWDTSLI